jgi:hypothetical protein
MLKKFKFCFYPPSLSSLSSPVGHMLTDTVAGYGALMTELETLLAVSTIESLCNSQKYIE